MRLSRTRPATAKFRLLIAIFGAGATLYVFANNAYPVVDQLPVWLTLLCLLVIGLAALSHAQKTDDAFALHLLAALLPMFAAAGLYANALADHTPPSPHSTTVVRRFSGKSGYKLKVADWRPSSSGTVSIPVRSKCYWRMPPGTSATVFEKPGALGIAWISGIDGCSQ